MYEIFGYEASTFDTATGTSSTVPSPLLWHTSTRHGWSSMYPSINRYVFLLDSSIKYLMFKEGGMGYSTMGFRDFFVCICIGTSKKENRMHLFLTSIENPYSD